MEHVNHPKHYNSHPNGIECIEIIRHYTCDIANAIKYLWRAGLKPEMGKEDAEKEIEDLKKALWYINDYEQNGALYGTTFSDRKEMYVIVKEITGYSLDKIYHGYLPPVNTAMGNLLLVGIIKKGEVINVIGWKRLLHNVVEDIQQRILDIETQLTNKEIQETLQVLHGQAVDGEDYVSKPGGIREDEPDKYDPLNMLVIYGKAYCLTDEIRQRPNGSLYSPCENCALYSECMSKNGSEQLKMLCHLHNANDQQYYQEVGICKYSPRYGTVEVVDEQKPCWDDVPPTAEE